MDNKTLDKVSQILLVVGGFNWGLIGWLDRDLVGELFGYGTMLTRTVYALVGVASLWAIYNMYLSMNGSKKRK